MHQFVSTKVSLGHQIKSRLIWLQHATMKVYKYFVIVLSIDKGVSMTHIVCTR